MVTCDLAELDEESGKVRREVTRVGRAVHGLDVDAQLRTVGEPDAEGLEHAERPPHPLADAASGVHRKQDPPEGRGKTRGQVALFGHFDVLVEVASSLGELFELVE